MNQSEHEFYCDFFLHLLKSNLQTHSCDCKLFNKKRHYEFLISFDINELLNIINQKIFCIHDLLLFIVFNREKQLISKLWEKIYKHYKIKFKLFLSQYSETNNQTEIINKFLKNYFWSYINHLQNDWIDFLSDIEFIINNFVNKFIKMIFFFADKSYYLWYRVEFSEVYIKWEKVKLNQTDKIIAKTEFIQ